MELIARKYLGADVSCWLVALVAELVVGFYIAFGCKVYENFKVEES